jgi:SulP family sulfate permease
VTNKRNTIFPLGHALRDTLQKGYTLDDLRSDLFAGLVVSLIALPLSMALAMAIGLPPQHGLFTAIVAGIVAALLGGSHYQVSGPTAAFVVILIPIVSDFGLHGLLWCQILAGILLILGGMFRLGKWIHAVPSAVVTGFTAAIALVLSVIALKDFFGLPLTSLEPHFWGKIDQILHHLPHLKLPETIIGLTTLVLTLLLNYKIRWLPGPFAGIVGGTLLALVFQSSGYPVATIGSEFYQHNAQSNLLFYLPTFEAGHLLTIPSLDEWKLLFLPAVIIAGLAGLESLLSATLADKLTHTQHHPNAELQGIGVANILTGLSAGIPATAAIARTATNIQNGAKSPFAAVFHSVFILSYMLFFSKIIQHVPMATLAALLLLTAYRMSHIRQFICVLKHDPLSEKIVLLGAFGFTAMIDMVAGVAIGVGLACGFYALKRLP